jgi:hypothetical protein
MTQHGVQDIFTCRVYGDLVASYNSPSMSCGQCILVSNLDVSENFKEAHAPGPYNFVIVLIQKAINKTE